MQDALPLLFGFKLTVTSWFELEKEGAQRKSLKRLFNKNTGLCKPERGSIGPDA